MYKVFVDNIPICFQKDAFSRSNIPTRFLPSLSLNDFCSFIEELNVLNSKETLFINSPDPLTELHHFFIAFEWIEAAGGIVKNVNTRKLLFIFRNGFWDIPKGKIEMDEKPRDAAIREIKEECGLHSLEIINELPPTYHVYFAYGKHFIKKTHWFNLETDEVNILPQLEEGITEVKWFDSDELDVVKENTFGSVLEVIGASRASATD
jgi:8-oxo-dGTP pyrophosphatase MutT (NUDIX family)